MEAIRFNMANPGGSSCRLRHHCARILMRHRFAVWQGRPAVHGVVRWRLIDLAQWIFEEFRITIAKQTLSRELRAMGYRKLSARPRHHAQAEGAIEDFKKTSPRAWRQLRARRRLTATR